MQPLSNLAEISTQQVIDILAGRHARLSRQLELIALCGSAGGESWIETRARVSEIEELVERLFSPELQAHYSTVFVAVRNVTTALPRAEAVKGAL